jgi:SAM-dependent methyltransferase
MKSGVLSLPGRTSTMKRNSFSARRIARAVWRWMDPVPAGVFQTPQGSVHPARERAVPRVSAKADAGAGQATATEFGGFFRLPFVHRRDKLLQGLDLPALTGAEIGPLDRPLVRKGDGSVYYVDHLDTEALRARWSTDRNIDVSKLQVDAVWGAQSLREGIAAAAGEGFAGLDYVVASHVIEHVPDVITWLQEIQAVLKPGGQLRLAVPDKRFTFDYLRRTSDLAALLYAWQSRARVPNGPCVLDFCLNMAEIDMKAAWRGRIDPDTLKRFYDFNSALAIADDARKNGHYHDVHCWVFTPASLARCFAELARRRLLGFACERFDDTEVDNHEFIIALRQSGDATLCAASWEAMAARAKVHSYTE